MLLRGCLVTNKKVLQFCSFAVMNSKSRAVVQSCSLAVLQSSGLTFNSKVAVK
jgi:hypothetical protein